jgi:hypothetical protein
VKLNCGLYKPGLHGKVFCYPDEVLLVEWKRELKRNGITNRMTRLSDGEEGSVGEVKRKNMTGASFLM